MSRGPGPDLDQAGVVRAAEGCPLVRRCEWLAAVGSTQERARCLAAAHGPGVLVVADRQTRGRGRRGSTWFSPAGGLWLSLAVAPVRPRREWPLLTPLAALALRDALREDGGVSCGVKWPNDLLCGGRKIAGVLAESTDRECAVIGVGLNVAQTAEDFPAELRGQATSLRMEGARTIGRERLLSRFLERLGQWAARFEAGGPPALRSAIRESSLLLGRTVSVGPARGCVVDIGSLGELILEVRDPDTRTDGRQSGESAKIRRIRVSGGQISSVDPPLR